MLSILLWLKKSGEGHNIPVQVCEQILPVFDMDVHILRDFFPTILCSEVKQWQSVHGELWTGIGRDEKGLLWEIQKMERKREADTTPYFVQNKMFPLMECIICGSQLEMLDYSASMFNSCLLLQK